MEVTNLQRQIMAPFVTETLNALANMAGLKATVGEEFLDDVKSFKFKGYAVSAPTHGIIEGLILVHFYIETALSIANHVRLHMLGVTAPEASVTPEVSEALQEFCNTFIGLSTADLERLDLGIRFEPPQFIQNTEDMMRLIGHTQEIVCTPVLVEGVGRFYLNLLMHDKTEG